jgi:hypothetical protein
MTDPIIDELHRFREQALAEVGFDHHRFCERLREREQRSQKVVDPPRVATSQVKSKPPLGSDSRR